MKKGEFVKLLKNPDVLDENTLGALQEIVTEYPFFQAGRMLLLKNMYNIDHIRYNSELKQTAVYVADRSRLFCLINDVSLVKEDENENFIIQEDFISDETAEVSKNQEVLEKDTNNALIDESCDVDEQVRIELEEVVVDEEQKSEEVTDNYFNASDDYPGDDGEIFSFSRAFKERRNQQQEEVEDIVLPSADLLDYESIITPGYNIADLDDENNVDSNENHSFSDWLHIMRYSNPIIKEKEVKHSKKSDLINNFLSARPKIVPKFEKKEENVDLSVPSGNSDEDILSETLAEIYIKQGHKMKAISILEKLRLKYPEKNVYFARRISDLKNN